MSCRSRKCYCTRHASITEITCSISYFSRSLVSGLSARCLQADNNLVFGKFIDIVGLACSEIDFSHVALIVDLADSPKHSACARIDGGIGAKLGFHACIADKSLCCVSFVDFIKFRLDAYVFLITFLKIFPDAVKLTVGRASNCCPASGHFAQWRDKNAILTEFDCSKLKFTAIFHDCIYHFSGGVVGHCGRWIFCTVGIFRLSRFKVISVIINKSIAHELGLFASVIQTVFDDATPDRIDFRDSRISKHLLKLLTVTCRNCV